MEQIISLSETSIYRVKRKQNKSILYRYSRRCHLRYFSRIRNNEKVKKVFEIFVKYFLKKIFLAILSNVILEWVISCDLLNFVDFFIYIE